VNESKRLEFAPRKRVSTQPDLAQDFTRRVLNLDWAFISDESNLWDFHEAGTIGALIARIREIYGMDVSDIESAKFPIFWSASPGTQPYSWPGQ
jgi:hypothetical protein